MSKPAGKLTFKEKDGKKKKNKKKLTYEKLKKQDKKLKKRCICNHRSANDGKQHFIKTKRGDGPDAIPILKCKICGGELIADTQATLPESVRYACDVLYTASGIIRKEFKLGDKEYDKLVSAAYMNAKICDIYEEYFKDLQNGGKKKKKNKKKKKKAIKYNRVSY